MLRTLCSAFREEGQHTTVMVSKDIAREARYLGADRLLFVKGDPMEAANTSSRQFDACFLVAPETHGVLSDLTHRLETRIEILSCPSETVGRLTDKIGTCKLIQETAKHISVPPFVATQADTSKVASNAGKIGFPCVLKPNDGAGSEGTSILRSPSDSRRACARLAAGGWKSGLIQKFVGGRHLSATFKADGSSILPLSINTQSVSLSESLGYSGGSCPHPIPDQDIVWDDLKRIVRANNLKGLMGMDFVLDGEHIHFMEINPRMTTSCIGLSKVVEPKLGRVIIEDGGKCEHTGYAQWAIMPLQRTINASEELLSNITDLDWVTSPPFPVGPFYMKDSSKVLACVWGDDSFELAAKMNEARTQLSEMHVIC